jgi:hypothetical protein
MPMVIRTLYNNQGWKASCRQPGKDTNCWLCFEDNVDIKPPKQSDEICSGDCWERYICSRFRWGRNPQGRLFGKRARPGEKAFFIFKQPDGKYTLWGKSMVSSVDAGPLKQGEEGEFGYAFVHFEPFEPLPREKRARNLSDVELVGKQWLMGRYRYIDHEKEEWLEQIIAGLSPIKKAETSTLVNPVDAVNLSITLMPNIHRQVEAVANSEGRQVNDVIRQAIAEWLRQRKQS